MFYCCFTSSSSNNDNNDNATAASAATDSLDSSAIVDKDLKDDNKDNIDKKDNKYNPDEKLPLSDNDNDDDDEEYSLFAFQEKIDKMNHATTEKDAVSLTNLDLSSKVILDMKSEELQTLVENSLSTHPLETLKLIVQIGKIRSSKNDLPKP